MDSDYIKVKSGIKNYQIPLALTSTIISYQKGIYAMSLGAISAVFDNMLPNNKGLIGSFVKIHLNSLEGLINVFIPKKISDN